jgi:proteic killer suppression protein
MEMLLIVSFKNKGLNELFEKQKTAKIDSKLQAKILRQLDMLEASTKPEEMNIPGWNFHSLNGFNPTRYTVHVNGPWCVTFEFDGENAARVDFEQYH